MPLKELDSDGLQAVRAADAMVETDDELQFYPPSYTHRRQLLRRLDAAEDAIAGYDRLTAELGRLVFGADDNWSLAELVAEVRSCVEMQQGHAAAMAPPPTEPITFGDTWSCYHGFQHPVGDVCNHTEKDRL